MQQIEYVGNKIFSIRGLIQTTRGILSLSEEMFGESSNLFTILTSRFNQDSLENVFSYVRAKGGHCKNPSVHEFNIAMAKLLSLKISQFSSSKNCENDDAAFLQVDFQSSNEFNETVSAENPSPVIDIAGIYENNAEYFDESADCFNSPNVSIELTSSRYFIGYIAQRITCWKCRVDIIKPAQILTYPSEMYIHTKNYEIGSDFGSLCAPSDLFFEVCKIHIKIFEKLFSTNRAMKNIKKVMIQQCIECTNSTIYGFWFDEKNTCYSHRLEILNLLILTLLRKHSAWETQQYKPTHIEKINILKH